MGPIHRLPQVPTVVAGTALTVAAATAVAVSDDRVGTPSLHALAPLVEGLSPTALT